MADPVTVGALAAIALSMAAEAVVKGVVGEAVKDAYAALKEKVGYWAGSDVEALVETPGSPRRQAAVAKEVDQQPASEQDAVQALATKLMEALKQEGVSVPSVTVRADRGGVAAGRDMAGNTIITATNSSRIEGVKQVSVPSVAVRADRGGVAAGRDIHNITISTTKSSDNAKYQVWYGTNRVPILKDTILTNYSAKRDTKAHYGICQVFVPASHKIGSTGSPWWKRLLTGTDDRLRLRAVREFEADIYWKSLATHLDTVNRAERYAVVFIHGYNVTFEQAALRAAQIGFDLSIRSAMAFFSWPSQGTFGGYLADAAAIDASEEAITQFLIDFGERSGATTTHVIAHSMGNRGVLRAVDRIAERARRRTGKRFGQVILAAADVDADLFRQRCAAYARVARRTTLYVSTRDLAVEASQWLHDFPRAGLMPPVLVAPGIDTINVANVDLTQLGHGYIAEARDVLVDIHHLIRQDTPPQHRFGLRLVDVPDSGRFWTIGA